MTTIRGQALPLPKTFIEFPDKRDDKNSPPTPDDAKEKDAKSKKDKSKSKDKEYDLGRMVTTSMALGSAPSSPRSPVPPSPKGRDRSGSLTGRGSISGKSGRGSISGGATPQANNPTGLLPSVLPRSSIDNGSLQSSRSKRSLLSRLRHSNADDAPSSPSSSHNPSKQQYTITMVPQHDIHITWPYPVPSGNAFIAGTFPVPGHQQWDKIPMTRIPGTDTYEVHLNIQEVEDISDYVDDDGYTHHAIEHHDDHHHDEEPSSPASTQQRIRKRDRIRKFFGRSRASSTAERPKDLHVDLPYHHQSKDGIITPLTHDYKYQYKFVIDDVWQCDQNQPVVWDDKGNQNHELAVTLVEQIHQAPSPNRSRSSSVHSQHSAQAQSTPSSGQQEEEKETTTSHDIPPQDSVEETPALTAEPEESFEYEYPSADNTPLSSEPGTPIAPRKQKSMYEADFTFDEFDMNDDDARSRRGTRYSMYKSMSKSDNMAIGKRASLNVAPQQDQTNLRGEQADDTLGKTNIPEEGIINSSFVAEPLSLTEEPQQLAKLEEEVEPKEEEEEKKVEQQPKVEPEIVQQPKVEPPKEEEEEALTKATAEEGTVAEGSVSSNVVEPAAEEESVATGDIEEPKAVQATEPVDESLAPKAAVEDLSATETVEEPLAPKAVDEPAVPEVVEEPTVPEVVDEPTVPEVVDESAVPKVVDESEGIKSVEKPEDTDTADEPVATNPIDESAAVDEPLASVAVDGSSVDEEPPVSVPVDESVPEVEAKDGTEDEAAKPVYVLQAPAEIDSTRQNNNRASRQALEVVTDNSTPATYSQVPSPPLTPRSAPSNMDDQLNKEQVDKDKQEQTLTQELTIPVTPQTDLPLSAKLALTSEPKEKQVETIKSPVDSNSEKLLDVLSDHVPALDESNQSKKEKKVKKERVYTRRDKDQAKAEAEDKSVAPNENIVVSVFKTTMVVSAAMIVLGLGLGRR